MEYNVHDGARWYNPELGSFASQDASSYLASPADGNRYAYAADNPVNNTDPTGHISGCKLLGWIALGVTAVGPVTTGIGAIGAAGVLGEAATEAAGAVSTGGGFATGLFGFAAGLIGQIC